MRVKKYLALLFAAILATTILTGCPWEEEEDKTDDASSIPVTSTDTSQDDDSNDSGNKDEEEKIPDPPTITSSNNSGRNGTVAIETPTYDKTRKTFSVTFTTTPADKYTVTSATATVTVNSQVATVTWPEQSTLTRAMAVRADTQLSLTTNDEGKTFTLTGIPADATSCTIDVTFEDLGYVIENGTYKVHSAKGLKAFADAVNGGNESLKCALTDDINLENKSWIPIDDYAGTFDGDGHTISGLTITSDNEFAGFFGSIDWDGTV